jgi:uncharacterized coiled-coil protein SlyX
MVLVQMVDKDLIISLQQQQIEEYRRLSETQQELHKQQDALIKILQSRIAELESSLQNNSSNSGKPPGGD